LGRVSETQRQVRFHQPIEAKLPYLCLAKQCNNMETISYDQLQEWVDSYDEIERLIRKHEFFNDARFTPTIIKEDGLYTNRFYWLSDLEVCIVTKNDTNDSYIDSEVIIYNGKGQQFCLSYEDLYDTLRRMEKYELTELESIDKVVSNSKLHHCL
jgi:hypothetical protein